MLLKIKAEDLYEEKLIEKIENNLKDLEKNDSYNVIIEYFNENIINNIKSQKSCQIDKKHLLLKNNIREYFERKNIPLKKLYILGSKDYNLLEEATLVIEKAQDKEGKKNIIWPCKEIFFYDGGKKILDDMLENDEIDIVEYENQVTSLKYEFGLLDELEDELYLN